MFFCILLQDFCYEEDEDYKVLDAINTMITVVAYQTESLRSTQMLVCFTLKTQIFPYCFREPILLLYH